MNWGKVPECNTKRKIEGKQRLRLWGTAIFPAEMPVLHGVKEKEKRDFPDGLVVKTLCFHCKGAGLIPGQGTKIPWAVQCGKDRNTQSKNIHKVLSRHHKKMQRHGQREILKVIRKKMIPNKGVRIRMASDFS